MKHTPQIPDFLDRRDPLAQALHQMRMTGVVYCHSVLSAPWGLDMPPMPDCLVFHVVTAGSGWLLIDGEPARELRHGDFALMPQGVGHLFLSEPGAASEPLFDLQREPIAEWLEVLRHGGGGLVSEAICGAMRFDDPVARHLAASLPRCITIEGLHTPEMEWLHSSFRLLVAEAGQRRAGSESVITRLADIIVIQAIRSWVESSAASQTGWLRGLQDRHVGRALASIHRDPAQPLTLADLAREGGLSRSAFTARFTQMVGTPPMAYVTQWRMRVALARLQERRQPLAQLAAQVGYDSEAAFNRAFKRVTGLTPGSVRRGATGR